MTDFVVLQNVGNGVAANDGTGDSLRSGAGIFNNNHQVTARAINLLAGAQAGGTVSFLTKADMDADLNYADGTIALVTNDPVDTNNQAWRKNGALGTGVWGITVDRIAAVLGNGAGFQQGGSGAIVRTVQDKAREVISGKDFGILADGVTDNTVAFANAFAHLDMLGGGILNLAEGVHLISMAQSSDTRACVIIPANTTIQGAGRDKTIITRPSSERTVNGVLMVNKGWDVNGGYGADGNIVLRDFTITDGDSTGQRTVGDLIGFGHGDGLVVERVHAGNHDQHFIDIAGSRNVTLRDCSSNSSTVGGYIDSATVQIDWATNLGISGLLLDGTQTTDVLIENCHFRNTNSTMVVQLGHGGSTAERIRIVGGSLDGAYKSNWNIISFDTNCSLKDCDIDSVEIIVNHADARGINLPVVSSDVILESVNIHHTKIRGTARVGIYAGLTTAYAGAVWPDLGGLNIHDNYICYTTDPSTASSDIYAISIQCFSGSIKNNQVRLAANDRTKAVYGIVIDRNRSISVAGNHVRIDITDPSTGGAQINPIHIYGSTPALGDSSIVIYGNMLDISGGGTTYAINYANNGAIPWTENDNIVISRNTFIGIPLSAHIYETFAASDGSNGITMVDFGGGVFQKQIDQGSYYSGISFGLKKNGLTLSNISPAILRMKFYPTAAGGAVDAEEIQFAYLSSTDCAGTQIADINQSSGTFSIITGKSGVSAVINNASFAPVIRTSGYLSVSVSI